MQVEGFGHEMLRRTWPFSLVDNKRPVEDALNAVTGRPTYEQNFKRLHFAGRLGMLQSGMQPWHTVNSADDQRNVSAFRKNILYRKRRLQNQAKTLANGEVQENRAEQGLKPIRFFALIGPAKAVPLLHSPRHWVFW